MQLPVEVPRVARPERQRRFVRKASLAALVAAPLLTLLPGFTESEPFAGLDIPGLSCRPVPASSLTRDMPRVVCRADVAEPGDPEMVQPGPPPKKETGTEAVKGYDYETPKGPWSEEFQFERVRAKTKWLRSLKGKFVPWGPKPWDPHRFLKVCIQVRLDAKQASNTKIINQVVDEMRRISGMHPYIVKSKKNIAATGWRKGFPCGVAVTLFGPLMYDFLNRLNTIILPRVRDFEGLWPNSFGNTGDYFFYIKNQEPFKELDELIESRELVHGFCIGIVNSCQTQPDGLALMQKYGFPFNDELKPKREKFSESELMMMNRGQKR